MEQSEFGTCFKGRDRKSIRIFARSCPERHTSWESMNFFAATGIEGPSDASLIKARTGTLPTRHIFESPLTVDENSNQCIIESR